jgi:capsular exopolysaccharide synthesis family protein
VRPSLSTNLAIGSVFGLVLGLGLVLGRETLDRSIRTPEHVTAMGLPFLGLLPKSGTGPDPYQRGTRRRRRGRRKDVNAAAQEQIPTELAVHAMPRSGIAEASRAIRTNVRFMSPDRPYKSLLVTSAAPSEGKTTVACCLAVAMAQSGDKVLLLDCDLRRPRLHRVFARDNSEGVTTLLLDPSTFDPQSLVTPVPNLSLLPSGPHAPNPAELVNSERFGSLLRTLGEHYDRIVIDSPPVAPVTDAAILSTRVDATVLVVRAFKTTKEIARRSLQSLRDVGAPLAGAVLNAVEVNGSRGYYYYEQYTYGYGETEVDTESASTSSPTA